MNDPVGSLPQEELDRLCIEVRDRYLAKDARSARIAFACELQGFVAAEVERGGDFADAMRRVGDLVGLLIKAQEQGG